MLAVYRNLDLGLIAEKGIVDMQTKSSAETVLKQQILMGAFIPFELCIHPVCPVSACLPCLVKTQGSITLELLERQRKTTLLEKNFDGQMSTQQI